MVPRGKYCFSVEIFEIKAKFYVQKLDCIVAIVSRRTFARNSDIISASKLCIHTATPRALYWIFLALYIWICLGSIHFYWLLNGIVSNFSYTLWINWRKQCWPYWLKHGEEVYFKLIKSRVRWCRIIEIFFNLVQW